MKSRVSALSTARSLAGMSVPRVLLYGVHVDSETMEGTVRLCLEAIESGRFSQQTSLNAGKVVLMHKDRSLFEAVASSDIVSADGQSVVWASRILGARLPERVAGIDLMERLLEVAETRGYAVYFLGASQQVVTAFTQLCIERYPDLRIAGFHSGFFEDEDLIAGDINHSGAQLLFVAMPSPQKELFLARQSCRLGRVFVMGVGGSFDVWTGVTRRAPRWMQRLGLEWFFRFAQEPRRMWRRYLVGNARFVLLTFRTKLGIERWGDSDS